MAAPSYQIYRDGDCHSVSFIDDYRDALYEGRSVVDYGMWHCRETQANAFGRRHTRFVAGVEQPHPYAKYFAHLRKRTGKAARPSRHDRETDAHVPTRPATDG